MPYVSSFKHLHKVSILDGVPGEALSFFANWSKKSHKIVPLKNIYLDRGELGHLNFKDALHLPMNHCKTILAMIKSLLKLAFRYSTRYMLPGTL